MQPAKHQPETLLDPFIPVAFWMLTMMVIFNVKGVLVGGTTGYWLVIAIQSLCCLLLTGLVRVRLSQALGMPGALVLGMVASYLSIGLIVSHITGVEVRVDLGRQLKVCTVPFLMIPAIALGIHAILERMEVEAFLKSMLRILTVSCILILLSPILHSHNVLALNERALDYSDKFRLVGTFLNPNEAGLVGCLTAVLALAFLHNARRPHVLGYLSLTVGSLATLGSLSRTAIISWVVILIFFLLLNGRGNRRRLLLSLLLLLSALTVVGAIIVQNTNPGKILQSGEELRRITETVEFVSGKRFDDTVLAGRKTLWKLGWRQVLESPIVGHGLGRLRVMDDAPFQWWTGRRLGVHNMYLMLVGEAGIVPLSLYLLYLFSLLRLRWILSGSLARDVIVGWAIVVALSSFTSHNLLALWTVSFVFGVSCAMTAALMEAWSPSLRCSRTAPNWTSSTAPTPLASSART